MPEPALTTALRGLHWLGPWHRGDAPGVFDEWLNEGLADTLLTQGSRGRNRPLQRSPHSWPQAADVSKNRGGSQGCDGEQPTFPGVWPRGRYRLWLPLSVFCHRHRRICQGWPAGPRREERHREQSPAQLATGTRVPTAEPPAEPRLGQSRHPANSSSAAPPGCAKPPDLATICYRAVAVSGDLGQVT